jgi:flagellar biosynthesis chaperone FliJ
VPAFRFRLGRVLRVREIEEEVARARWIEAVRVAEGATREAEDLAANRQARQIELAGLLGSPSFDASMALAGYAALDRLAVGVRGARERARSLAVQAETQRTPWGGLRRARRSREPPREKKLVEHLLEDERTQAREIDAIASERASRAHRMTTRPAIDRADIES